MNTFEKTLSQYDYTFPPELIAQAPSHPRDNARLLIYDRATKKITHDIYKNLIDYLPKNSVLVLNQTKVLPARLEVAKPTGGKARILYLRHGLEFITVISDRKLQLGSTIQLNKKYAFTVHNAVNNEYVLKPQFPIKQIIAVLNRYGHTPLPLYIKHPELKGKKLDQEYNTVFAKIEGSVAAPTASLHFTKSLLNKIERSGIAIAYVTLHVNLGTFASLTQEQFERQKLHGEEYFIDKKTAALLNKAKKQKRPIVAVGTTVVRTLESASNNNGELTDLSGETRLFITEKTKLHFVDQLATNFHVPKSSLMMLVSAFTGRKELLRIYHEIVKKKYRLFSFGDGMLVK